MEDTNTRVSSREDTTVGIKTLLLRPLDREPAAARARAPAALAWAMSAIAARLLDVLEHDILPFTERGVVAGNKVFGAGVLRKADLSAVVTETNGETTNPLWHGEIHTLIWFDELSGRPASGERVFLSTHEPYTMCMSAITWAGFDNVYYFFSPGNSRDSFAIPHGLKILSEVFGLQPGGDRRSNAFWTAYSIPELVDSESEPLRTQLQDRQQRIRERYDVLSVRYQESKGNNSIPLN